MFSEQENLDPIPAEAVKFHMATGVQYKDKCEVPGVNQFVITWANILSKGGF